MTEPGVNESKPAWIALTGLCLAVLVPVLPLLLQRAFVLQHDVVLSDLIHNQFPYRAFLGEHLREGSLPLWMPDVYSGVPFLAQIEAGLFYVPHAVLFGLVEPYAALNLAIVLALVTSAAGAWALDRIAMALGGTRTLADIGPASIGGPA